MVVDKFKENYLICKHHKYCAKIVNKIINIQWNLNDFNKDLMQTIQILVFLCKQISKKLT
jgi:hypothetical protein